MGFMNQASKRARDRVPDARGDPARTGHVPVPQRVGVLGARVQRPRPRVQPARLERARGRHDDGRLHGLRARAGGDAGARAVARDGARPRGVPGDARARGRARRRGARAEGRAHRGEPSDGDRALGRARGRARRLRGAVRRVRRARGAIARRDGRHDGAVLVARGAFGVATASRACTTAVASGRCSSTSPPTSACRSRRSSDATIARIADTLDPGHGGGQPARRVGNRHRRRPDLPRRVRGVRRRPRGERERVLRRHDAAGRAVRRGLPRSSRARRTRPRRSRSACCRTWRARSRNDEVRMLRDAGIPVLEGTESGLRALGHLLDDAAFRARPPVDAGAQVDRRRPRLAGATGSRPACRCPSWTGWRCWPTTGCRTAAARPASSAQSAVAAADGDRLPGRAEDGGAGHHAQVRRRRRARRARRRRRGPRAPTRTSPAGSARR